MWTVPLLFASEFLGYIAVIQGNEHRVARAVIVSTAINMCVNLALVPMFGFMGAAVMTVVTEAVLVTLYVWMLRAHLRLFSWGLVLVRPALATAVMAGALVALREVPLLSAIVGGAVIYTALLLALGVVGRDELHFLRTAGRRPAAVPPPFLVPAIVPELVSDEPVRAASRTS
jgi:O-antigen/teichoic acid export membrane protein